MMRSKIPVEFPQAEDISINHDGNCEHEKASTEPPYLDDLKNVLRPLRTLYTTFLHLS